MRRTRPVLTVVAVAAATLRRAVSRLRWGSTRAVSSLRSASWHSALRRSASAVANLLAVLAFLFLLVLVIADLVDRAGETSETSDENDPVATILARGPDPSLLPTLTIDSSDEEVPVRVEIADTNTERQRGLMERTELAQNAGMLFVFDREQTLSFFMKDTLIPLSVAYINAEGYIVDIQDMQPLDLTPHPSAEPASYALEVNQGFFEEHGVEVGDRVQLPQRPVSAEPPSSADVVQAFREAGLEVWESYPVEQEPGWDELPVPKTYEEATRFEIPSLGEDSGGRVFVFESEENLAAVRDYYEGIVKAIRPYVYVEGNVLVEINHRLPQAEAEKYGAVLKVSNIQSRQ